MNAAARLVIIVTRSLASAGYPCEAHYAADEAGEILDGDMVRGYGFTMPVAVIDLVTRWPRGAADGETHAPPP
jgi:hypothetical protein